MEPWPALTQIVLTLNCNISVERSVQSPQVSLPPSPHDGHLASKTIFLPDQLGWVWLRHHRETQTDQHQPFLSLYSGLGGEKKEQQPEVKLVRILFLIVNILPPSPVSSLSLLHTNIKTKTLRWAESDVMSYNWPTSDGLDCISVRWGFLKTVWRSDYTSILHIGHGYL